MSDVARAGGQPADAAAVHMQRRVNVMAAILKVQRPIRNLMHIQRTNFVPI